MNKIIKTIKQEYNKNKISTIFMGLVLIFALLTFLKPSSAGSISNYIGLTAVNLLIISGLGIGVWWVFFRRKR